jgi:hypothetical protein
LEVKTSRNKIERVGVRAVFVLVLVLAAVVGWAFHAADRTARRALGPTYVKLRLVGASPSMSRGFWIRFEAERTGGTSVALHWYLCEFREMDIETY